ncbi:MAG: hypothetical protein ACJATA_000395 [Sphingobacteriales bacterium]|jgi:hypothetical protein
MRIYPALLLFFLIGCSSQKNIPQAGPENIPKESIFIGEGGGFTGAFSGYEVFRNGQIVKWERNESNQMDSSKWSKKDYYIVEDFFIRIDRNGFKEMILIDPGNYYYTLETRYLDSTHSITWGGNNKKPPTIITEFYAELKKLCQGL